jgi:hypothetical protein
MEEIRIRDPGWKKFGYGINIPDPQHCYHCWNECLNVGCAASADISKRWLNKFFKKRLFHGSKTENTIQFTLDLIFNSCGKLN